MSAADEATRRALRAKQAHEAALLAKANVLGVGVGLRQRSGRGVQQVTIVVLVRQKVPLAQLAPPDRIPAEIDGVPIDVQEVGEVRAGA
ncbi:MAG TPA: hypothetical protein VK449_01885 [Anaerolineales bacterium]|nr:hypothetical protein [Anaerolineales bacterium]